MHFLLTPVEKQFQNRPATRWGFVFNHLGARRSMQRLAAWQ